MSDIDISEPLSDMLAPLNNEQKEFLMNNYTIQTYKKNETIYCEGETPSHLMCLISGKVKIFKDGVGGRSQIIRMIKPREYFAYRAYFAKQDFVTAAAAFEPSVVCLIPMSAITTLVAQNNDLAMFFIRQLSIDCLRYCSFSFFREDYAETDIVLFLIFRIGLIKSAVLSSGLSTDHLPIASEGISYKMAMPVPFRISPCLSRPEIRRTSVSAI